MLLFCLKLKNAEVCFTLGCYFIDDDSTLKKTNRVGLDHSSVATDLEATRAESDWRRKNYYFLGKIVCFKDRNLFGNNLIIRKI